MLSGDGANYDGIMADVVQSRKWKVNQICFTAKMALCVLRWSRGMAQTHDGIMADVVQSRKWKVSCACNLSKGCVMCTTLHPVVQAMTVSWRTWRSTAIGTRAHMFSMARVVACVLCHLLLLCSCCAIYRTQLAGARLSTPPPFDAT